MQVEGRREGKVVGWLFGLERFVVSRLWLFLRFYRFKRTRSGPKQAVTAQRSPENALCEARSLHLSTNAVDFCCLDVGFPRGRSGEPLQPVCSHFRSFGFGVVDAAARVCVGCGPGRGKDHPFPLATLKLRYSPSCTTWWSAVCMWGSARTFSPSCFLSVFLLPGIY